jgi:hypothetical protein
MQVAVSQNSFFPPTSQKRSFLREPDEQYPISPQSPDFVLKTASQIQILKALLGAINWKLHKVCFLIITT